MALFICSALPTSCSNSLPQHPTIAALLSRDLPLCVPCPEVLSTGSLSYKHPKPPREPAVALLARALPDDLILKRHGFDGTEVFNGKKFGQPASDNSLLLDENDLDGLAQGVLLRGSEPRDLSAPRLGRMGSSDWSMSEEEFQHRLEDAEDATLDFAPILKGKTLEQSAKEAAVAVAAAAANMDEIKFRGRSTQDEAGLESEQYSQPPLELECAWRCIPHPLKVARGGEDVHMICRYVSSTLFLCDCCTAASPISREVSPHTLCRQGWWLHSARSV